MKRLIFKRIFIWSGFGSLQWLLFVTIDKYLRNELYSRYGTIVNESSGRTIAEIHFISLFDMHVIYSCLLLLFILSAILINTALKESISAFSRWQIVGLLPIVLWTLVEQIIGIFNGYDFYYYLPGLLAALVYFVIIQLVGVAVKYNDKRNPPMLSNP